MKNFPIQGEVAEWSKALVSGTSLRARVRKNSLLDARSKIPSSSPFFLSKRRRKKENVGLSHREEDV